MSLGSKYICPYCKIGSILDEKHFVNYTLNSTYKMDACQEHSNVEVLIKQCPICKKFSYFIFGGFGQNTFHFSYPPHSLSDIPDYVPSAIQQDYIEACSIKDLSPKSSATLARRCMQGMIHDFWGINKGNLGAEINALKEHIPAKQWAAIDAVRRVGNIGAHMGKDINLITDIEPNEAELLIKLIEYLIQEWYIKRHDEDEMLEEITRLADQKIPPRDPTKPEVSH